MPPQRARSIWPIAHRPCKRRTQLLPMIAGAMCGDALWNFARIARELRWLCWEEMPASDAINIYVACLRDGLDLFESREATEMERALVAGLRSARIYAVEGRTYGALHASTEKLLHRAWTDAHPDDDSGSRERFWAALQDTARAHPFTEPLPFGAIFVAYVGGGWPLSDVRLAGLMILGQDPQGARLFAHLVVSSPAGGVQVYEFIRCRAEVWALRVHHQGKWLIPIDLEFATLPALVKCIMRPTNVARCALTNMDSYVLRKLAKSSKATIPRLPYYKLKVDLDEGVVRRRLVRIVRGPARKPQYAYDQRGTMRLKVRRGQLPMDLKVQIKLVKRGWFICTDGQLPSQWSDELAARGKDGRRHGEWIALQLRPVGAGRKNRKAPYLPGLRVVKSHGASLAVAARDVR